MEWISVKDRLPGVSCYVMLCFEEVGFIGRYFSSGIYWNITKKFIIIDSDMRKFHITHWGIPELPNE